MTPEEMARAYAEGFSEEYREVAYEAFLCGYGAKCTTETTNGLEEAEKLVPKDLEEVADEYEKANTGIYPEVGQTSIRDAFIDGARWQAEHSPLPDESEYFVWV